MSTMLPTAGSTTRDDPRSPSTGNAATRPMRWPERLAGWLLPGRCALCGCASQSAPLCAGCRGDLRPNRPSCARCAEPLPQPAPACGRCLRRPPPFDRSYAAFRYAWPLDGLLARFKFSGSLAAGRALGRLFAEQAGSDGADRQGLLVPVPLHRRRLRQRGFDQALELAREISRELRMPIASGLLRRARSTHAQTELDAPGRRRNVRGAFEIVPRALARLEGRPPLVLIDDVMTTGSTAAECAKVLRRHGFGEITVWAVARAPARA